MIKNNITTRETIDISNRVGKASTATNISWRERTVKNLINFWENLGNSCREAWKAISTTCSRLYTRMFEKNEASTPLAKRDVIQKTCENTSLSVSNVLCSTNKEEIEKVVDIFLGDDEIFSIAGTNIFAETETETETLDSSELLLEPQEFGEDITIINVMENSPENSVGEAVLSSAIPCIVEEISSEEEESSLEIPVELYEVPIPLDREKEELEYVEDAIESNNEAIIYTAGSDSIARKFSIGSHDSGFTSNNEWASSSSSVSPVESLRGIEFNEWDLVGVVDIVDIIERCSGMDTALYARTLGLGTGAGTQSKDVYKKAKAEYLNVLKSNSEMYSTLCKLLGIAEITKIGIGIGEYMLPDAKAMKLHCTDTKGKNSVVILTLKEENNEYILHKVTYPRSEERANILSAIEGELKEGTKRFIPFTVKSEAKGLLEYYKQKKGTICFTSAIQNIQSLHFARKMNTNVKMGTFSLDIPIAFESKNHGAFIMPEVVGENLGEYIDEKILGVKRDEDGVVEQDINISQEERFTKLLPLGRDILQGILSAKAIGRAGIDIKFENCIVAKDRKGRMRARLIDTAEMMGERLVTFQGSIATYFPYQVLLREGLFALKKSVLGDASDLVNDEVKQASFLHLFDLRAFLVIMLGRLTSEAGDLFLGDQYTTKESKNSLTTDRVYYEEDKTEVEKILKTLCSKHGLSDTDAQTVLDFVFIRIPEYYGTTPAERRPYRPQDVQDFLGKEKDILRILSQLFDLENYEDPQFETALQEVVRLPINA